MALLALGAFFTLLFTRLLRWGQNAGRRVQPLVRTQRLAGVDDGSSFFQVAGDIRTSKVRRLTTMEHARIVRKSVEQPRESTTTGDGRLVKIQLGDHHLVTHLAGDPSSPPVVLLHGIPGWRGTWRRVGRLLAPRHHVIAPDLAGFGESSAAPAKFHAADHAALIVALIRELGCERVHLVGFDFGGPTAVMVCAQAPELVASLTLASTNVLTDTPIPLPLRLVRPPVVGELFARILFGRTGLTLMWFGAVARRDRFPLSDYRMTLRFAQGVTSTRRLFQASLRDLPGLYGPVQAALAGIQVPCVVVWGDADPFFSIAVGQRTAAQIPGARFVPLKGCGHFLPEEDPGGLARVIGELVSESNSKNPQVGIGRALAT